jgi:hypothetical protein
MALLTTSLAETPAPVEVPQTVVPAPAKEVQAAPAVEAAPLAAVAPSDGGTPTAEGTLQTVSVASAIEAASVVAMSNSGTAGAKLTPEPVSVVAAIVVAPMDALSDGTVPVVGPTPEPISVGQSIVAAFAVTTSDSGVSLTEPVFLPISAAPRAKAASTVPGTKIPLRDLQASGVAAVRSAAPVEGATALTRDDPDDVIQTLPALCLRKLARQPQVRLAKPHRVSPRDHSSCQAVRSCVESLGEQVRQFRPWLSPKS